MDIAVVGSNMVDLISYIDRMPTEGETVEALDFRLGCGGKGANQAVAASRLGSDVLMVTRVGNDMFADNTIRNLEDNGIDTTYVMRTEATSGVAPIFVDPQSRNSIIIVKGANAKLCADDIAAARQAIAGCKLIITQLEIPLETVYTTVDLARELGIPVLLNPAPADPRMSLDRVRGVEFIVPNESELSLISGMPVDTRAGIPHVIVTLGAKGALWVSAAGQRLIPAQTVEAVDTTGAGDAFIGCFSHMWTTTGDVEASIRAANQYAADSVTRRGTQTSYAWGHGREPRGAR